jgi:hypothetical protein
VNAKIATFFLAMAWTLSTKAQILWEYPLADRRARISASNQASFVVDEQGGGRLRLQRLEYGPNMHRTLELNAATGALIASYRGLPLADGGVLSIDLFRNFGGALHSTRLHGRPAGSQRAWVAAFSQTHSIGWPMLDPELVIPSTGAWHYRRLSDGTAITVDANCSIAGAYRGLVLARCGEESRLIGTDGRELWRKRNVSVGYMPHALNARDELALTTNTGAILVVNRRGEVVSTVEPAATAGWPFLNEANQLWTYDESQRLSCFDTRN